MSSKPNWSPEPWVYDPEEHAVVTDTKENSYIIAFLYSQAYEGNGPLLAAAKELYEALFMLSNARNFLGKRLIDNLGDGDRHEIERALAKARGESLQSEEPLPPDCQCPTCGRKGYTVDEFLSPYSGICKACQDAALAKARGESQ